MNVYRNGSEFLSFIGPADESPEFGVDTYGGNPHRLRRTKAAYDPTNLCRLNNITSLA